MYNVRTYNNATISKDVKIQQNALLSIILQYSKPGKADNSQIYIYASSTPLKCLQIYIYCTCREDQKRSMPGRTICELNAIKFAKARTRKLPDDDHIV